MAKTSHRRVTVGLEYFQGVVHLDIVIEVVMIIVVVVVKVVIVLVIIVDSTRNRNRKSNDNSSSNSSSNNNSDSRSSRPINTILFHERAGESEGNLWRTIESSWLGLVLGP